jgi:general secretion pathway protein E
VTNGVINIPAFGTRVGDLTLTPKWVTDFEIRVKPVKPVEIAFGANNVFDVLGRFTHMGLDPYSFVAALNGILAQRLIRVNCPHCAVDEQPDAALLARSGLPPDLSSFRFRVGRGCGQCRGSGYKGRRAIAEMLIFTDELRELIATRASVRQVKELAAKQGTRLLRDAAVELVRSGETSLTEINRVTLVA